MIEICHVTAGYLPDQNILQDVELYGAARSDHDADRAERVRENDAASDGGGEYSTDGGEDSG